MDETKKSQEEVFFLMNILNTGGCIRCISKNCNINEEHGIKFPEKMSTFVKNPMYINGMTELFEKTKPDFNGKKVFYTVCNYVNKSCRNCQEGRIKYIDHGDKKIGLCHPILDDIKTKITVGVHIDIKLIMKGHRYDVSFIPIDINFNKIFKNNTRDYQDRDQDKDRDTRDRDTKDTRENLQVNTPENFPSLNVSENFPSLNVSENFPSLNISENLPMVDIKIKDFSIIKKKVVEEEKIESIFRQETSKIAEEEEKKNKLNNDTKLTNLNKYLENQLDELKYDLKKIKEELSKEKFKVKNSHMYEEIIHNIKTLNNRVTEQFVNTNYTDYLLL